MYIFVFIYTCIYIIFIAGYHYNYCDYCDFVINSFKLTNSASSSSSSSGEMV